MWGFGMRYDLAVLADASGRGEGQVGPAGLIGVSVHAAGRWLPSWRDFMSMTSSR